MTLPNVMLLPQKAQSPGITDCLCSLLRSFPRSNHLFPFSNYILYTDFVKTIVDIFRFLEPDYVPLWAVASAIFEPYPLRRGEKLGLDVVIELISAHLIFRTITYAYDLISIHLPSEYVILHEPCNLLAFFVY